MKKRWIIYGIIGILFGIFDFYYQEFTERLNYIFNRNILVWFIVAWGIWLIPVIPIDFYEAKTFKNIKQPIIANIFIWVIAVCSYYIWIPIKWIFIGQPSMSFMHISNCNNEHYLDNLKNTFWGLITEDAPEWIVVAIVGGSVIGFLVGFSYIHLKRQKNE
ncbi:hypothetical protein SAMN04487886_102523 [Clostridium sp. DSM 8431]|uniref:hypothetical protein n=1 Tax=Clostridium sp. DSM 8431 TaxID=1761781 RepID=UPI0008F29E44|nr:hypothetical protein [Clostridium sp. DSM 8431]SFU42861.1 hypothetical protein SAMN04487886_102523 [Clostridium sp. DSM 8431]